MPSHCPSGLLDSPQLRPVARPAPLRLETFKSRTRKCHSERTNRTSTSSPSRAEVGSRTIFLAGFRLRKGRSALCCILAALAAGPAMAQLSPQAEAQLEQKVASLASQPTRITLNPISQGVAAGQKFQVQVTLLSADSKPVSADRDRKVDVELQMPSGTRTTQSLVIPKGQTSTLLEFSADKPGLVSVTARPTTAGIRPAKTDVLIVPPSHAKGKGVHKKPTSQLFRSRQHRENQIAELADTEGSIQLARFELPKQGRDSGGIPERTPSDPQPAQLYISIDNAGSDYVANGSDAAKISAYFESPDGTPAPQNIDIWFTLSRGALDPRPLQIPKGSYSGVTRLTSKWPGSVHVNFVSSNPPYQASGSTDFDVQFVPLGAVLAGPDKLSVIDNVLVWVVFVNDRGPIAPGKDWQVTLRSSQSKLAFIPINFSVKADSAFGSALLFPRSVGSDTIEAVVPDYELQPLKVTITWKFVLALCLAGGILGGIAAYEQFKGSWFWRIFLGLLGGAVLSWLYVFLALPLTIEGKILGNIAHNTISVFFVSVVGGYMGIRALGFVGKKLGWLE